MSRNVYGVMDDVVKFRDDVQGIPAFARSRPSFNAATIMEETINGIRESQKRAAEERKNN